jgi:hypothetical protein
MKLNKMLGKISLLVALVFPFAANSTIIMIDNTDAGFSSSGFVTSTASCCVGSAIGTNYMVDQPGSQGDFAIWDASGDANWVAGIWQVEMNWTSYFNRASNTLVTIGSGLDTLFINQTINGGTWQDLGQFTFADVGSFVKIDDSNSASGKYLIADAVRFSYVSALPNAVPAPSALLIMALGLFVMSLVRRKI